MSKHKHFPTLFLISLVFVTIVILVYGEKWLRRWLLYLSSAGWARQIVTGNRLAWRVASRFVAGETIDSAILASRELNLKGMHVALDYLGESVTDPGEANLACEQILQLVDRIHQEKIDGYVSVKLSQLGIGLDEELAVGNLRAILERARQHGLRVRIDMEDSPLTDVTLAIYRLLRDTEGYDNVGIVIQSYLYRSEADVRMLVDEGAWVRLVKGAYMEPAEIAFPNKSDTDANFVRLTRLLLSETACANGVHTAIASHDEEMILATTDFARANEVSTSCFEFQMLYGIRRELQETLLAQGYEVRVYVPYGTAWYPYFMRRLAERPANLWFFISNLLRR